MAVVSFIGLTSVKFASISSNSSFSLWLTLVIHSSVVLVVSPFAIVMYMSVVLLFRCPRMY